MAELLILAPVLAVALVRAPNQVLVVDDSGGAPYTQIQPAVDAAVDGDTVLVKAGTYAGFAVAGKDVDVVADSVGLVLVQGTVEVSSLTLVQDVLLHRFTVQATGGPALIVQNDAGSVRVQGCDLHSSTGSPGALVGNATDVIFQDCRVSGADGCFTASAAVSIAGGRTAFFSSEVVGGAGGMSDCIGCSGADALTCTGSAFLFAGDTLFTGGNGANGATGCVGCQFPCNHPCHGGSGGDAIDLTTSGGGDIAWIRDDGMNAGANGFGGFGQCGCEIVFSCWGEDGDPGQPIRQSAGDVAVTFPGDSPLLQVEPNPAREGQVVELSYLGDAAGETVLVLIGTETEYRPRFGEGIQAVPTPWPRRVGIVGTTNEFGRIHVEWIAPDLEVGVESRTLYVQPIFVALDGARRYGSPVGFLVLDSSF